jgi:AAA family ATP:ADP antiporter
MAIVPALMVIAVVKGVENSLNYSLQNTARHSLFLVTSREAKFTAKTFIDTFVWRAGDVLAAVGIGVGQILALQAKGFIWLNLGLIGASLFVMAGIAKIHRVRAEGLGDEQAPQPEQAI